MYIHYTLNKDNYTNNYTHNNTCNNNNINNNINIRRKYICTQLGYFPSRVKHNGAPNGDHRGQWHPTTLDGVFYER